MSTWAAEYQPWIMCLMKCKFDYRLNIQDLNSGILQIFTRDQLRAVVPFEKNKFPLFSNNYAHYQFFLIVSFQLESQYSFS